MRECSYCGEMKLCREECMDPLGLGQLVRWYKSTILLSYNLICEECDRARNIIHQEERAKEKLKEKEHQRNWIKERDKLLKRDKQK
jgi:hypothetical protein